MPRLLLYIAVRLEHKVKPNKMRQIIIGREGNQPFPINDEYVSRQHAIFTYDEVTGAMMLTDKSRPNVGTFVRMGNQYQQITQCNVDATTDVRLGPYFTFRVGQLFQTPASGPSQKPKQPVTPPKPKQEKVDIAYLRKVAENYEETKLKLEQKHTNVNSLRTMSIVGSVAGGTISALLGQMLGEEMKTIAMIAGFAVTIIFLVSLMLYCSKANKAIILKKNQNEKTYKISFCCPKCHVPFTGKLYENILAEGKCPKCKAEFYDSNI